MIQRVTELTEPPVIGQRYLVPTVLYPWAPGATKAERARRFDIPARPWPVLGNRHEDREHLGFPWMHYHVDSRFVTEREYKRVSRYGVGHYEGAAVVFEGVPLNYLGAEEDELGNRKPLPHPPVVWKAMTCRRPLHAVTRVPELAAKLTPHYEGKVCKRGKAGFICPHKNLSLGSMPVVDGVITCPLHGLRIDAESGVVLAADAR